jgi:hypothetical protein
MKTSESITEISAALALAQAEIETAEKDRVNPHFKQGYATLASVWEACRKPLTKHGLSVVQSPGADGTIVTLTTMLLHKSGQWFQDTLTMASRDNTPQSIGSAITYARRYALASMVGVAPDDDDGNAGSGRNQDHNGGTAEGRDDLIRFKNLRADLNKRLTACQTEEQHRAACKDFAKLQGSGIWLTFTHVRKDETFQTLAQEHLERCQKIDVMKSVKWQEEWRQKLEHCEIKEFPNFVSVVKANEWMQTPQNIDAIHAKGRDLNHPDYVEAEA